MSRDGVDLSTIITSFKVGIIYLLLSKRDTTTNLWHFEKLITVGASVGQATLA